MIHLLAEMKMVEVHVTRVDSGVGPAWLWVLVFAVVGFIFAITLLAVVMLLRRNGARKGGGKGRPAR